MVRRIYVEKKDGKARRSAQTAMYTVLSALTRLVAPLIAFTAEEIWQAMGHNDTIAYEPWPTYDEAKCKDSEVTMAVQVNGKMRGTVVMAADLDNDAVIENVLADAKIAAFLEKNGGNIVKTIVVKNKLVNLIVK